MNQNPVQEYANSSDTHPENRPRMNMAPPISQIVSTRKLLDGRITAPLTVTNP